MEDNKVSSETHVFIGMFRPPWEEVLIGLPHQKGFNFRCPTCGAEHMQWGAFDHARVMECWQMGHYDTSLYKTIEEVVRMKNINQILTKESEDAAKIRQEQQSRVE